jgi:hypothetical protein
MTPTTLADLQDLCARITQYLANQDLRRPLKPVRVTVPSIDVFDASVQTVELDDPYFLITTFEGVLNQIPDVLEHAEREVMMSVLWPVEDGEDPVWIESDRVLQVVNDLATTFIFIHECAHILCGHQDLLTEAGASHTAFVESDVVSALRTVWDRPSFTLSQTESGGDASPEEVSPADVAYAFEMEADNTSIEMMAEVFVFHELHDALASSDDLDPPDDAVSLVDLTGLSRVVGFRLLVTAVWIVIALIEAGRLPGSGTDAESAGASSSHPLPSARLHAAVSTVLALYADLFDRSLQPDGTLESARNDEQTRAMTEFYHAVLRPVTQNLDAVPDPDTARRLAFLTGTEPSNASSDAPDDLAVAFLSDVHAMTMGEPVATEGARQLERLQAARNRILQLLTDYRYFEGMGYA